MCAIYTFHTVTLHVTFKFSDYKSLFTQFTKDWMLLEVNHRVSNRASNEFWSLAVKSFPRLLEAKQLEGRTRKIPGFRSIRKHLHKNHIPEILMDVCYEVKATGDMIILNNLESIPVKKFPPSKYKKLYETAKVKVKIPYLLFVSLKTIILFSSDRTLYA